MNWHYSPMNKIIRANLMFAGYWEMSVQRNLEWLLGQRGLNANSLHEESNGLLNQPTTRRLLSGKTDNVREDTLKKYANYFKVPLKELRFGDLSKQVTIDGTVGSYILGDLRVEDDSTPLGKDEVEVSCFREVALSVGSGVTQVVEECEHKVRISKQILLKAGVNEEDVAHAINSGKGMESKIIDGADLLIDKSKQVIKDGKIYAFNHGGLLRVKYLYRQPYGGLKLVSENSEFEDEFLSAEQVANDFRLLGWVFWWSTIERW